MSINVKTKDQVSLSNSQINEFPLTFLFPHLFADCVVKVSGQWL